MNEEHHMLEIREPATLKECSIKELKDIAQDLRNEIIDTVALRGGHLASNLGAVEAR